MGLGLGGGVAVRVGGGVASRVEFYNIFYWKRAPTDLRKRQKGVFARWMMVGREVQYGREVVQEVRGERVMETEGM